MFDLAFGAAAALLGGGLLVAAALHLIASVGLTPESLAIRETFMATHSSQPSDLKIAQRGEARLPQRTVAPISQRVRVDRPKRLFPMMPKRAIIATSKRAVTVAPKRVVIVAPKRAEVPTLVAAAITRSTAAARPLRPVPLVARNAHSIMQSGVTSTLKRVRADEAVRLAAALIPRRPSQAVQPQRAQRNRLAVGRSARPRRNVPLVDRLQPSLLGVSGAPAIAEPRLDGLRMRGKLIVPTPAPTPPYVAPVSRNGLTPGP